MMFEDVSKLALRSPVGPFALGAQAVERPPPHPAVVTLTG
jgi:hypothetical protein